MIRVDLTYSNGDYAGTVYTCHGGYSEASLNQLLAQLAAEYTFSKSAMTFAEYLTRTDNFRYGARTTVHFEAPETNDA